MGAALAHHPEAQKSHSSPRPTPARSLAPRGATAGVPLFLTGVIQRQREDEEVASEELEVESAGVAPGASAAAAVGTDGESGDGGGDGAAGAGSDSGDDGSAAADVAHAPEEAAAATPAAAPSEEQADAAPVQTKLILDRPGDPFEREADQVADAVMSRDARHTVVGAAPGIQRPASDVGSSRTVHADAGVLRVGGGAPLRDDVRASVEPVLGASLAHVRVHDDAAAHRAASGLHAKAFTHGSNVWLGRGQSASDVRLMAHELTHVVQQGAASRTGSPHTVGNRLGAPSAESRVPSPASRVPSASRGAPSVQRLSWSDIPGAGLVKSGARLVGRGVRAAGRLAKRGVMYLLRKVVPEIVDLASDPIGFLKKKIMSPITSWIGGLMRVVDIGGAIDAVRDAIGGAFALIQGVMKGEAKSCESFNAMIGALREFGARIANSPPIQLLRTVLGTVFSVVKKVVSFVGNLVFEILEPILGAAWQAIKKIASTIWGWIKKVKDLVSEAWDWVAEKLGFSGGEGDSGEGGIWNWVKRKAQAVWDGIRSVFGPIIGPIGTVAKVLFALSPLGPIYVAIKYGPELVESVKWLWAHRGEPDIVRKAHKEMGHTILPRILDTAKNFGTTLADGARWLGTQAGMLADAAGTFLGGITGIPILSLGRGFAQTMADGAKRLGGWVETGLKGAASAVTTVVQKVWNFIKPLKEVLTSIALAIASPPMIPLILGGWAWRMMPDNCIKAAILNFILDIAIAALEAIPDLFIFGPLWPILKSGIIGFLKGLRKADDKTKEKVSNKIAKILSGASLDFIIGFVKGVLEGVWEGITDPFKAIWLVIEGLHKVQAFFEKLAIDAFSTAQGPRPAPVGAAAAAADGAAPSVAAPATATPTAPVTTPTAPLVLAASAAPAMPLGAPAMASAADGPAALGTRVTEMAGELAPDVHTTTSNFWDAAKEYFEAGEGVTFDSLVKKLGEAWDAFRAKLEEAGGTLAAKVVEYFSGDSAESDLGEKVGWLAGTIAFQVLLDVLTAGAWAVAYPTIALIARFINWPMEVLGQAFKVLAKLGKYIVDGVKGLAKIVREAGAGALKMVGEAAGRIGEKLVQFAEEIFARFGKLIGREGAGVAEKEGVRVAEKEAAALAEKQTAKMTEQQAARAAEQQAASAAEKEGAQAAEQQAAKQTQEGVEKKTENAAREAEQRSAAQVEKEAAEATEKKSAQEAAEEAAEMPAALAAARVIEVAAEVAGQSIEEATAAMMPLKARFTWIKYFAPEGGAIYLVASKRKVGDYRRLRPPKGEPVYVKPWARGHAIEDAHLDDLARYGFEPLPPYFKTIDGVSGGTATRVLEDGKWIKEVVRPNAVSIKSTQITDIVKLEEKIAKDLTPLRSFTQYTRDNVRVVGLGKRQLDLVFEQGVLDHVVLNPTRERELLNLIARMRREAGPIEFNVFYYSSGYKYTVEEYIRLVNQTLSKVK